MVNILNLITIGEKQYLVVDKDPATDGGLVAEIGSMAVTDEGGVGKAYIKVGAADDAWDKVSTASDGGIAVGDYLKLPIYNTSLSGQTVDDIVQQNGYDVSVGIEAQGSRSVALEYLIPNPGNAIASASFVLSEGDQEINGIKTFNDDVVVEGDLTVNGSLTYLNTVNTEITDKSIVLNKGGIASSANGSGLEFEEAGVSTGRFQVSADRAGFNFKAPAASGALTLDSSALSANRTLYAPDDSGTAVLRQDPGVQYQVSFYNDANNITSSSDFVYDDGSKILSLGSSSTMVIKDNSSVDTLELSISGVDAQLKALSGQLKLKSESSSIILDASAGGNVALWPTSGGAVSIMDAAGNDALQFDVNSEDPSLVIKAFEDDKRLLMRAPGTAGSIAFEASKMDFNDLGGDYLEIRKEPSYALIEGQTDLRIRSANQLQFQSLDNYVYFFDGSDVNIGTIGSDTGQFEILANSSQTMRLEAGDMNLRTWGLVSILDQSDNPRLIFDVNSNSDARIAAFDVNQALVLESGGSSGTVRASAASFTFFDNQMANADVFKISSTDGSNAELAALTGDLVLNPNADLIVSGFGAGILHSSASGVITSSALDLTADVGSSVLPIANGGTNSSVALNNDRLMISSSGAIVEHSALSEGQLYFGAASTGLPAQSADLFWDASNARLGIGTNTPDKDLDVTGDAIVRGVFRLEDAAGLANREFSSGVVNTTDNAYHAVQTISIPTDSCVLITAHMVGRRTGGSAGSAGDSAVYIRTARVKNVAGVVSIQNLQSDYTSEEPAQSLWDGTMAVSGTSVNINVRGATNNNVSWHCWSEVQVQS